MSDDMDCNGCPIRKDTGRSQCRDTPQRGAEALWDMDDTNLPERGFKTAARKELAYLKALRKKLARKLKTEGSAT